MLKKTLLATSAILATLFALAAVLPALAEPRRDRTTAEQGGPEGRAVATQARAGAEGSFRSTGKAARGDTDVGGRRGSAHKKDHDHDHDHDRDRDRD